MQTYFGRDEGNLRIQMQDLLGSAVAGRYGDYGETDCSPSRGIENGAQRSVRPPSLREIAQNCVKLRLTKRNESNPDQSNPNLWTQIDVN
jgi:hypothetical protein